MGPKHVVTQVLGTVSALLLIRWGWREYRSDWKEHCRLPLVTGPYMGGRTLLIVFGAVAALVPILLAVVKFELVPRGSAAAFVAMLAWLSLGFVFLLFGALSRQTRRSAKGWITIAGEGLLRIDADGTTATLKLRPGAAALRFVEGSGRVQYVQLDLDDGNAAAHVWGMVGLRDMKLVLQDGAVQARGLMVASSMSPLCRWLAPYLPVDRPPTE
ncbi:MAG TPA: hypothetical protein VHG72_17895 [Polyangia bacterium]|nr:hypothetical protein [Polyangia bacterium]HVZ88847.1 hypothetical protein [Polyangia bacterium]